MEPKLNPLFVAKMKLISKEKIIEVDDLKKRYCHD